MRVICRGCVARDVIGGVSSFLFGHSERITFNDIYFHGMRRDINFFSFSLFTPLWNEWKAARSRNWFFGYCVRFVCLRLVKSRIIICIMWNSATGHRRIKKAFRASLQSSIIDSLVKWHPLSHSNKSFVTWVSFLSCNFGGMQSRYAESFNKQRRMG